MAYAFYSIYLLLSRKKKACVEKKVPDLEIGLIISRPG